MYTAPAAAPETLPETEVQQLQTAELWVKAQLSAANVIYKQPAA